MAQYERKDESQKPREAQAMNVDLIDMNAFMEDEPQEDNATSRTKGSDGSDHSISNTQ